MKIYHGLVTRLTTEKKEFEENVKYEADTGRPP